MGKIDSVFQFYLKSIFESLIFFIYQVIGPSSSRKTNLSAKFYFHHFLVLIGLEERENSWIPI
jgi:hypothetical protein